MVGPFIPETAEREYFRGELIRFGPDQAGPAKPHTKLTLRECEQYCQMWASRQYENFTVVSWLLPRALRQHFYNVYAYCRWSDNLADEIESDVESLRLLDWWEHQLQMTIGGAPTHPVLRALEQTIAEFELSLEPFLDLLSAFRQDRQVNRYGTDEELVEYCRRSADPVGRILLSLARSDSPENIALSDQVCTGLQLANFCQDMARDAAIGRVYVPADLMEQFGVTPELILAAECKTQMQDMLGAWIATTRERFVQGWSLVHNVPSWLATDIELFIRGGTCILDRIELADFDVWTERPTVSKSQKLRLAAQALKGRVVGRPKRLTPNWLAGQGGRVA